MKIGSHVARAENDLLASLRAWFVLVPLFGVLAPLLVVYGGFYNEYLVTRYNLHHNILSATIICLLGISLSSVSFLVTARSPTNSTGGVARGGVRSVFLAWLLFLVVLVGLTSGGSPSRLYQNVVALTSKARGEVEGQTYIYLVLSVFMVLSIILAIRLLQDRGGWERRVLVAVVLAFSFLVCFALGSRARALAVLIAPIVFFLGAPRLRWLSLLPAGVLLVLLFSLGDYLRRLAQGRYEASAESPLVLIVGSFSVVDGTAVALEVGTAAPQSWGESLQTIFLWYLPSSWVGQKDLIGSVTARYILEGDVLGGITFGTYGDLYFYFGTLGVVLGSPVLGGAFGLLSRLVGLSFSGLVAYCGVFYYIFLSTRNGVFNDLIFFAIIGLLVIFGELKASFERRKRYARPRAGLTL